MANLCDYVNWRGDIPFNMRPFNAIDALLLCQLSYLNLTDIVPNRFTDSITLKEAARNYTKDTSRGVPEEFGVFINPLSADLLIRAAETERFGFILLKGFVNETDHTADKQFSAITAVLPAGCTCVVYRGTDDTIVGWKEDCLLCLPEPIPSHTAAVRYLAAAAEASEGSLFVAGHSKGGNLALYAAGMADVLIQERINRIFCFDAPGFAFDAEQISSFRAIIPKTVSFMPQSSIVGVLLCYLPSYTVIKSDETNAFWQHDAFSWQIQRDDFIQHEGGRSKESYFAEQTLQTWLSNMDDKGRREFIDTLFQVISGTGAKTLSELTANGLAHSLHMLKELHNVNHERRKELFTVIKSFFAAVYAHFPHV